MCMNIVKETMAVPQKVEGPIGFEAILRELNSHWERSGNQQREFVRGLEGADNTPVVFDVTIDGLPEN